MRSFDNIALIGMMGSGKSAVGRALANRLGWSFVDTDAIIVAAQGRSIAAIFAEDGEPLFRHMETEAVREAVQAVGTVIATGGGAVLRPENRDALWERCWVVWLTATPEELFRRTAGGERRPVLEGHDDRLEAVRRILAERTPLYALADEVEDTTGRDVEAIVASILEKRKREMDRE